MARRAAFPLVLSAIGTVTPLQTVTLRSRVSGELQSWLVGEGQRVEAGQVVARIDPSSYRLQLEQALGQQQQNLAALGHAETLLRRYQVLQRQDSIARQQLEEQQALVTQLRGSRQVDQARVDEARLQLGYTDIRAPVAGRIGLRAVDAGNLVSAGGDEGLATLTQVQPISVLFSLPETRLEELLPAWRGGVDMPVDIWSRDGRTALVRGRLDSLDNRVDVATGTVRARAVFDNAGETLFPHQFVNVKLRVRELADVVIIDADAVQYGSRGTYVYVADAEDKARIRPVELGAEHEGRVVVTAGLDDGERIIIQGLDRLREGRAVQVMDPAGVPATTGGAGPA